ncbi:MAG: cytochrome c biogenesis protein CcdA [Phycisphaerales bacterium]
MEHRFERYMGNDMGNETVGSSRAAIVRPAMQRRFGAVALLAVAIAALSAWPRPVVADASGAGRPGGGIPGFGRPGASGAFGASDADTDDVEQFNDSRDRVKVAVELGAEKVLPGGDMPVAIVLDIARGWHVWTNDRPFTGDLAKYRKFDGATPTVIKVSSSTPGVNLNQGFLTWPDVHGVMANLGDGMQHYAVFEGRAIAYLPITIAADAKPGPAKLAITVGFQACNDQSCMREASVELTASFEIVAPGTAIAAARVGADLAGFPPDLFGRIRAGEKPPSLVAFDVFGREFAVDARGAGFLLLLLVAAIGGFLLNFTPCVLPVIPLKIMGLSASAGHPARCFALGVSMSLGVVAFWLGLGAAIAGFVSGFTSINQLFQYPQFTIGVGVVIAIMAVAMCGFGFTVTLPQWVHSINPKHDSHLGSFGFGVMTAVLSTPCTAPLMGAAAAWATKQPASTTLSVFGAIGGGMAMPYLVLSAFPKLVSRMPRTGPASDLIKQVMGLLLLAAAAYFIGAGLSGLTVHPPDPPRKFFWWIVAAFGVAAGAWLLWRTLRLTRSAAKIALFGGVGALVAAVSAYIGVTQTSPGPIKWTYYTPDRFASALRSGNVVVMDFTAEWCLNCKALEAGVLFPEAVSSMLRQELGVTPIKVDLTGNNPMGNDMLRDAGRVTIPLLVVFAPDGTEVFKSDSYTQQQVLDAIQKARQRAGA